MFIVVSLILIINILIIAKRTGKSFTGVPNPLILHQSEIGRYQIIYPRSWLGGDLTRKVNEVVSEFIAIPLHYPELIVSMRESSEGDLNSVAEWGLSKIRSNGDVESLPLEYQLINDQPVVMREYSLETSSSFGKYRMHCIDSYFFVENRGYIFRFCSLPMQWEIMYPYFLQMLENIKFN